MVNLYNNKIITTKADIWVSDAIGSLVFILGQWSWCVCLDFMVAHISSVSCSGVTPAVSPPGARLSAVQVVFLHAALWWEPGGHLWRQLHHPRQLALLLRSALPHPSVPFAFMSWIFLILESHTFTPAYQDTCWSQTPTNGRISTRSLILLLNSLSGPVQFRMWRSVWICCTWGKIPSKSSISPLTTMILIITPRILLFHLNYRSQSKRAKLLQQRRARINPGKHRCLNAAASVFFLNVLFHFHPILSLARMCK